MALVCRIKQSKLRTLSDQFKRYYFQIHSPCSFNQTASSTRLCVLDHPNHAIHRSQFEFCNNVRLFAAPVQAKPKREEKDPSGPRLNEQITAEFVRLVIDDEGHQVVSRRDALQRAKRLNLDLVEVQRTAKPPVCKIMDYNKERYKQQIKDKDRAKSKAELTLKSADSKEVRFTAKIEQKDLQMKADMAKRLMERGYRVKCLAMGTEDQDLKGLLTRFSNLIEDIAIVESGPDKDKKGAHIIFRHVKFGPSKKGSGKKAAKGEGPKSAEVQNSTTEMVDKDIGKNKSTWSDFHESDDFDQVFDLSDDSNSIAESCTDEQIKVAPQAKSSPANIFSVFAGPTPVLDSMKENTVPLSRLDPTSKNQRPQPQGDLKFSPPTAKPNKVETDASSFRNLRLPAEEIPKQEQSRPSVPSSKQEQSRFGIFSSPKANDTPGKHDVPVGANRYQNGKPFNSVQNHSPGRVSENPNLPSSNSGGSQRPGIDKGGQGKWGIFSKERSNVDSNRSSENQTVSRR